MKSKIMINLKKFISVLLCSILISSTLPCNLLNTMVSAVEYDDYHQDDDGNIIVENLKTAYEGNFIIRVFNENNNHEKLTEKTDYEVNFENKTMIINASYAKNLQKNTEIEFKLRLCPNAEYIDKNIKEAIESEAYDSNEDLWYKLKIKLDKLSQETPPDNEKFNNLKSQYTYGEDPGNISLNGGSGTGTITYKSSDPSVATINQTTGKITILKTGTFYITATKASDKDYEELTVTSDLITVTTHELSIENIKIKDKVFDDTKKAEFAENVTPTLKGVLNNDNVSLNLDKVIPSFENIGPGQDISIKFNPLFSLFGTNRSNYHLKQPEGIKANINEYKNPKIDKLTLTKDDGTNYEDGTLTNKSVTLSYNISKGSFPIDPKKTMVTLDDQDYRDITKIPQIDQVTLDESNITFTIKDEGTFNNVNIKIFDTKGHSTTSSPVPIKIQKTQPDCVTIKSQNIFNNKFPTFYGKGTPGCTVYIVDKDNKELGSAAVGASGEWAITLNQELTDSTYSFKIYQEDAAGNRSDRKDTNITVDTTAPTVTIRIFHPDNLNEAVETSNSYNSSEGHTIANISMLYLSITAEDAKSKIKSIEYFTSDELYTIEEIPKDTKWTEYRGSKHTTITRRSPGAQNEVLYIYARATDAADNVSYVRSGYFWLFTNSGAK